MFPNLDPRLMKTAMKRMGISQEEVDASEVIIKSSAGDIIIKNPNVVKIKMGGQESFQITGEIKVLSFSEDDVKTVAEQAKVSLDKARDALLATNGDLAEAIIKLTNQE